MEINCFVLFNWCNCILSVILQKFISYLLCWILFWVKGINKKHSWIYSSNAYQVVVAQTEKKRGWELAWPGNLSFMTFGHFHFVDSCWGVQWCAWQGKSRWNPLWLLLMPRCCEEVIANKGYRKKGLFTEEIP